MNLSVENFFKVSKADLSFEGLTVIVGENDTGKSTIGKLLFSLFDIYSELDERVGDARFRFVLNENRWPNLAKLDVRSLMSKPGLTEADVYSMLKKSPNDFRPWGMAPEHRNDPTAVDKEESWLSMMARGVYERIASCRRIPDRQLALMEIMTGLGNYFNSPLLPQNEGSNGKSRVALTVKGKTIAFSIDGQTFSSHEDIALLHRAWFVGSPSLLNAVSRDVVQDYAERVHTPLLSRLHGVKTVDNVNLAVVSEKLKPIMNMLHTVLPGEFATKDGGIKLKSEAFPRGLPVESLSMGLKAFALLRLMLEREVLQDEDVLILDEPENHLHPSWQLVYAEIIVLLQKAFGLTILLTTHSPYFLEAVRLFSRKHGANDLLRVYMPICADADSRCSVFTEITRDPESLYKPFSAPLRDLQTLTAELD